MAESRANQAPAAPPAGCTWEGRAPIVLPAELLGPLAPATCALYEWDEYWLDAPGADRLRVGSSLWLRPALRSLFRVRFENRLGLTSLRPYRGEVPLAPALHAEVISRKLGTPARHLAFLRALLADLYAVAASLPLAASAPTARGVGEAPSRPSPLAVLHFVCAAGQPLRAALAAVRAAPHRAIAGRDELVPIAAATEIDADAVVSAVSAAPEDWSPAPDGPLAAKLRGRAPSRVWQRVPHETYDTPENRFVRAFLLDLAAAAASLPAQSFWPDVPAARKRAVIAVTADVRDALRHGALAGLGPMAGVPLASQVLMRRAGYRDVLGLWHELHRARRPLFEALQNAADLRDAAQLYELWAFFALASDIASELGVPAAFELDAPASGGLAWGAVARFGERGSLVYNAEAESYSGTLRPDFVWVSRGAARVVLDAKFRMDRADAASGGAAAERSDIAKMHAYRDALGVRAAVCVYPGDLSVFYRHAGARAGEGFSLRALLHDEGTHALSGVGAIAMWPGAPRGAKGAGA